MVEVGGKRFVASQCLMVYYRIGKYLIPNSSILLYSQPVVDTNHQPSHFFPTELRGSHILQCVFPGTIPNQLTLEREVKSNHHLRSRCLLCFMVNAVSVLCSSQGAMSLNHKADICEYSQFFSYIYFIFDN